MLRVAAAVVLPTALPILLTALPTLLTVLLTALPTLLTVFPTALPTLPTALPTFSDFQTFSPNDWGYWAPQHQCGDLWIYLPLAWSGELICLLSKLKPLGRSAMSSRG